jgi:hypothetical protein
MTCRALSLASLREQFFQQRQSLQSLPALVILRRAAETQRVAFAHHWV